MKFSKFALYCCCLALSSCSDREKKLNIVDERLDETLSRNVPQDANILASSAEFASKIFLKYQQAYNTESDIMFFSPWKSTFKPYIDRDYLSSVKGKYAENLHKWTSSEIAELKKNAAMNDCPSRRIKAISIRNTMSYILPTEKPFFEDINRLGGGYPFNENISNMIYIGTPLLILHVTADKAWFLVAYPRSVWPRSLGWVKANDVAFVDEPFIRQYIKSELFVSINDDVVLLSESGRFLSNACMGTILPGTNSELFVPCMGKNGYAEITKCRSSSFVKKPYAFTRDNLIEITRKFLGTKYGWGGYLNNRDCSIMTRDFTTIFGILIPRSSKNQLRQEGCVSIKNISDKSSFLRATAIPFLTLIGWKGHVMLYVGSYADKAVFIHNVCGIKIGENEEGRYVIGKTILSSFDLSKEIESSSKTLEDKVELMYDISAAVR
ncbi:MAG: SH3 domain-containing protein [Holosporaceae bacterium]|jgi:hypothetical protein|nr:SH3 domain-containing protein [Holosporaceae bacterium]